MLYESKFIIFLILTTTTTFSTSSSSSSPPTPKPWPHQFHSRLIMTNKNGALQINDLWYDWTNGRNFNIIQNQLGKLTYDLEWNNGSSYYYTLNGELQCKALTFPVGILRPNWLDGATYLGQRNVDGFLCNVWEKVDFITYFEDVLTNKPVHWIFYTGMAAHVMTFEVGAVLDDAGWQAPSYCFTKDSKEKAPQLESAVSYGSRPSLMKSFGNAQSHI